ncbi:MAG: sugar transferase [Defluviicoccus sp.]|nr:MAG: sugar transferase [Defluviicoccus sp.]
MQFYPTAKRVLDMAVAAGLLLAVLPLLAMVALLIRLQSPGSVLFCQPREGRAVGCSGSASCARCTPTRASACGGR